MDRICWLVVSDLHLYYKNFANRKNYAEELSSVKMYCWSLAEKYKQAGWDSVNLLLLGDVFHRGYQSTFSAVNDSAFFLTGLTGLEKCILLLATMSFITGRKIHSSPL